MSISHIDLPGVSCVADRKRTLLIPKCRPTLLIPKCSLLNVFIYNSGAITAYALTQLTGFITPTASLLHLAAVNKNTSF